MDRRAGTARWVRRLALAGSAGFIVAAAFPSGAVASSATPPSSYAATSTAVGVEYSLDKRPQPTPVADLIHGVVPRATGTLGDGSLSNAQANTVFLGGIEGIPGLICTAGLPCDKVPGPTFPPPFPLEAKAQYPSHQTDTATTDQGAVGGHGAPLLAHVGNAEATAHGTDNTAVATGQSTNFATDLITTGASSTTTKQYVDAKTGDIVSTAESTVHDVNIIKLVHVGTVHSETTIRSNGKDKSVVQTQTTVSGVSVLSLAAGIDDKGVHIVGQGDKGKVLAVLNKQLNYLLSSDNITIALAKPTTSRDQNGTHSQAGGLAIGLDDTVAGVPDPPPIPDIPFCRKILGSLPQQLQDGLSQVPADLCNPAPGESANGRYVGIVNIASVGSLLSAANYVFTCPSCGGSTTGGTTGVTTGGTTGVTTGGTTGLGTTGSTTGLSSGFGTTTGGTTGAPPPITTTGGSTGGSGGVQAAAFENFGNVAHRLSYLFPALLLAVIGILAGRLGRPPARLPRVPS